VGQLRRQRQDRARILLLAVAAVLALAGTRLQRRLRLARPGRVALVIMFVTWVVAIAAFLICVGLYVRQESRVHLVQAPPADPIAPVTLIGVGVTFFVVLVSSQGAPWTRLSGAVIGGLAAPMIFEFPVRPHRHGQDLPANSARSGVLPGPVLHALDPYRDHHAGPAGVTSPGTAVQGHRLVLRGHAARVRGWSLFGFAYPSAPGPIALNVLSKILAFVTTLSLFLPPRPETTTPVPRTDITSAPA
jgi:hypothetical protein